jgi:hypothetical protein
MVCVLLAGAACQQNELGISEILRIAEKRLSSEEIGYQCREFNYETYRLNGGRSVSIDHARKQGDHILYCSPSFGIAYDGEKIVIVSKSGAFRYGGR